MTGRDVPQPFSLGSPEVQGVLRRLHADAGRQRLEFVPIALAWGFDWLLRRTPSAEEEARRFKDLYIPLSPETGTFAYLVARSLHATRIVEFGTSFGISTIPLAAAVRDDGGGVVIGSELEPGKVRAARANLHAAGLGEYADIRAGDARETLRDPGGTVVLADNIHTFPKALAPYVAWVRDAQNGFHSVTLPLGTGTEYSVRL
ncbi:MAG TPA: class I SAM-dependent methyltransferase [Candidatus Binatia bacterium]|nr:class I SAM-dependent methyltransferase [Candidatus Binatia bacterium]